MIKNIITSIVTTLMVAILVVPALSSVSKTPTTLGSQVETVLVWLGGGVRVGNLGNNVTKLVATTCDLVGMNSSQLASTTASYDCAITGARSGDTVMAQLATSTQNASVLHWNISSARASTTPGFVTVRLQNFSGANAVPSATAVGSSTRVLLWRN